MSSSPASRLDLILLFCFGFSCIAPGFDPFILFRVLIHSFCFGFSSITPGFDPFLLFRVLRHRARIRSLRFVSGSLASCPDQPLYFVLGSPASRPDSITSFCFGFSDITLGFDPIVLFRVIQHRAQIQSLCFV